MLAILALSFTGVLAKSLLHKENIKINYPLLSFIGTCALSLTIGSKSLIGGGNSLAACWLRLAGFVVALSGLSSLVNSESFRALRRGIWVGWWTGAAVLTVCSFAVLLYALAASKTPDFHYFGFKGIMAMGMTLSPIAALTALLALYKAVDGTGGNATTPRWLRLIWIMAFAAAAVTAVTGGSRIAVAGLIVGCVIIAASAGRDKKSMIVLLALATAAIAITVPAISNNIRLKTSWAIEAGTPFSSRTDKWQGRLAEFASAPLTGIGFGAQTVFNSKYDNPDEIEQGASPEPGSSWLALLAQTGLLGAASFLWFLMPATAKLIRRGTPLATASLLFLLLNGVCEGWLLYSSALLFPCFWLTTSLTDDRISQS